MPIRRRNRGTPEFTVNLTPLLDVVLQLITFFMMLIHFGTKLEGATRQVRLPVAPAALPGADLALDRLTVSLDARGRLLAAPRGGEANAETTALDDEAAQAWWSEQAALRRAGRETLGGPAGELTTVVIIRADRAASYGAVRRALAAAQGRGFARFSLVVLQREEK